MDSHVQLLFGVFEWRDGLLWKIGKLWFYRLSFSFPVLISNLQVGFPLDGYGTDEGVPRDKVGLCPGAGRNHRVEGARVGGEGDIPVEGCHGSDLVVVW